MQGLADRRWRRTARGLQLYLVVLVAAALAWLASKAIALWFASQGDVAAYIDARWLFTVVELALAAFEVAALWLFATAVIDGPRATGRVALALALLALLMRALDLGLTASSTSAGPLDFLFTVGMGAGLVAPILFMVSMMRLATMLGRKQIHDRLGLVIMLYVLSGAIHLLVGFLARLRAVSGPVMLVAVLVAIGFRAWMLFQLGRSVAGSVRAIGERSRELRSFD